jgi:hypothetical protein
LSYGCKESVSAAFNLKLRPKLGQVPLVCGVKFVTPWVLTAAGLIATVESGQGGVGTWRDILSEAGFAILLSILFCCFLWLLLLQQICPALFYKQRLLV